MKVNKNYIIGGVLLVMGLGAYLFLKQRQRKKSYVFPDQLKTSGNTGKNPPSASFNPKPYANNLFKAMDGWGTDEDMIWKAMGGLTSDQRKQVETYFNKHYGDGKNLQSWFEAELSGTDLQRALSFIT